MIALDAGGGKRPINHDRNLFPREPAPLRHNNVRHHRFVKGIILLPNCRQARAPLECDLHQRCLRARSASERRIPQPPSPPEFGVDRAQVFCVASLLCEASAKSLFATSFS